MQMQNLKGIFLPKQDEGHTYFPFCSQQVQLKAPNAILETQKGEAKADQLETSRSSMDTEFLSFLSAS